MQKIDGPLGALVFALGLPGRTPKAKMSFPLGMCDKNQIYLKSNGYSNNMYSNPVINSISEITSYKQFAMDMLVSEYLQRKMVCCIQ